MTRPFPGLETERLRLRPFRREDAEAVWHIYSDDEVMRYIASGTVRSMDELRAGLGRIIAHQQRHGISLWAVIEKSSGEIIGDTGLKMLEGGPDFEVGYRFARRVWGRGYASEAARETLRYGFDDLALERIYAVAMPENAASQRVMAKIGMVDQGRERHYGLDVVVWVAKREAWLEGHGGRQQTTSLP